jgi:Cu+-exporting ATPase
MQATVGIDPQITSNATPRSPERALTCFHCGSPCGSGPLAASACQDSQNRSFCCAGCRTVCELLSESGLDGFYTLGERSGKPVARPQGTPKDRYAFLDTPEVFARFVHYRDAEVTRVTFRLPAIHCVACVWLLENLFRLHPGIGRSAVAFTRKEVTLSFNPAQIPLSEVASLLESIGYEPDLNLADLDRKTDPVSRRLWLQVAVAGFAFGNTMLFSLPSYFGLDQFSGPGFRVLFGWLSLGLSLPVVSYSALDYWKTSLLSLRQRRMSIDVPIAAGIAALWLQSAWEIVTGRGEGYFDSLAGLLFFLLCGRIFQQKTFERLSFDRDYRSFFPLSVLRRSGDGEERVALDRLAVGDRIVIRNGELIPADSRVIGGGAVIDYSFVTGESEAVSQPAGELVYAGGRQVAGAVELEIVKPVSQSHLTSLWDQDAFRKPKGDVFDTLTHRYSRRFTWIILGIALGASIFWSFRQPEKAIKSFTSVLIVACPCALALAAPITLGTGQRLLGRRGIFLRNSGVIETVARIDTVVFDKTGTLTEPRAGTIRFHGEPLTDGERRAIFEVARHSTHPLSRRIARLVQPEDAAQPDTESPDSSGSFSETTGRGILGCVANVEVRIGSHAWLSDAGVTMPATGAESGAVWIAFDGRCRGGFTISSPLRREADALVVSLQRDHRVELLSGDSERERERFAPLFGTADHMRFHQSPADKLGHIRELQSAGQRVMMIGDGLNDAGALREGTVGVAVVEEVGAFSPASDVILEAARLPQLRHFIDFSRAAVGVVRLSFAVSTLYNIVGLAIAASGNLAPVVCAILMPLSSATVVAVACGATHLAGHRHLGGSIPSPSPNPILAKTTPRKGKNP